MTNSKENKVTPEQIHEAFNFRHATKTFDSKKQISDEDFNVILEAAQLSPSSYGFEPWNLLIIQDKEIREEFLAAGTWGAKGTLPTASHFVVMTAKTAKALQTDSKHIEHIQKDIKKLPKERITGSLKRYQQWLDEDFIIDNEEKHHQWAAKQAYIALGNMMTTAAFLGIDSCPIEGFNLEKITNILANHKLIDLETDSPVVMIAFGYRIDEQPEKTRRPINEIVKWV
ncbi:MAG: NAD(P)H-dependent oxidoreductase [Micrococcaceae bacterium]